MTLNELKNDCISLGFESEIENGALFLDATRRALYTLYNERGLTDTLTLSVGKAKPTFFIDEIKEAKTLFVFGKCLSLVSYGDLTMVIDDERGRRTVNLSGEGNIYRALIYGDATLSFSGQYAFVISNLAVFGVLFGRDISDIPVYTPLIEYKLSRLASDFLSPASSPLTALGEKIAGAYVSDGVLYIPRDYVGKVTLKYRKAPPKITGTMSQNIPLPPECEHLFALLVASYVWLDDDAEKAQYYMSLYREGMANVKLSLHKSLDTTYRDVLGWA